VVEHHHLGMGQQAGRLQGEQVGVARAGADEVDLAHGLQREGEIGAGVHGEGSWEDGLSRSRSRRCCSCRTGDLATPALINQASRLGLAEGADFLKTSTGKTPHGATPEAARVMLQAIATDLHAAGRAGIKASGGVRSVADAAVYIEMVESTLGAGALVPARFRIGASGLLADIEAVLAGRGDTPAAAGY